MPKRKCNFVLLKKSVFHRHTLFPSMTDLLYCVCFHSTPESTIAIKHQHQLLGKTRNTRQPSKGLSFSRRLASKNWVHSGATKQFPELLASDSDASLTSLVELRSSCPSSSAQITCTVERASKSSSSASKM